MRSILSFAALLVAAIPAAFGGSKPNVLLISCDDLNQELGCYGNAQAKTPNMDRLAQRGLRFERPYAQWASCLPSRVSFLSGWSPEKTQVWSFDFDAVRDGEGPLKDAVYLPRHFKDHGYTTARLDKIFHIGTDRADCWDISEEPRRLLEDGSRKTVWTGIEIETLGLEDKLVRSGEIDREKYPMYSGEGAEFQVMDDSLKDEDLFDGRHAKRAVELLEQFAKDDEPFFLAVGFRRPHLPWIALEEDFAQHPPESIRLPPQQPGLEAELPDDEHRRIISHYYAATTFVDRQIGKTLDALERLGLADNTVVVLMGDHGYCLGERDNHFGKGKLWELSLRTALIIATPEGHRTGEATGEPVALLDLYPTLVELCGLPYPKVKLDGSSLAPLLAEGSADWREGVRSFSKNKRTGGLDRTIRTQDHRYTESADGTPLALYQYSDDPLEWNNLVAEPAYAQLQKALSASLSSR